MDPFHWMRGAWQENGELDERLLSYLEAENEYCEQYRRTHLAALQRSLVREMNSHTEPEAFSVPERVGDLWYYLRYPSRSNHPVYCRATVLTSGNSATATAAEVDAAVRRLHGLSAARSSSNAADADGLQVSETVLIDQEAEGANARYIAINVIHVSPCTRYIGFTRDTSGSEKWDLVLRRCGQSTDLDVIENVMSFEWVAPDAADAPPRVIYTITDELHRPHKAFLHTLGRPQRDDQLLYEEPNDACFLDITLTKDWRYLLLSSSSKTSSEVRIIDARDPQRGCTLVKPRVDGVQYYLDHAHGRFYLATDADGAHNFKLLTSDSPIVADQHFSNWTELIPHCAATKIEDVDIFSRHLVCFTRVNASPEIRVYPLDQQAKQSTSTPTPTSPSWFCAPLPSSIGEVEPGANLSFDLNVIRYSFSSPIHPMHTYDFDLDSKHLSLVRTETVHNFRQQDYTCHRVMVPSNDLDATRVPLTIVKRADTKHSAPALILGYGAYGHNLEVYFRSHYLSLLDRGWILAMAHVRGGGELGRSWHVAGKQRNKLLGVIDFVACAKHLVDHEGVDPARLTALGESAGGLLVAAAVNHAPGLFRSVVLKVPFVDVLNTMRDQSLPLTIHEYDEWGNPCDRPTFYSLFRLDPYVQLGLQPRLDTLPNMLVTSSTLDFRVPVYQPAKYVARIREMQHSASGALGLVKQLFRSTTRPVVLFNTSFGLSHNGEGGRLASAEPAALEQAFLIHTTRQADDARS